VAWLTERFALARARAALAAATGAWALGVVMMLSFNHWAFEFRFFDTVKKLGLFDATQILTSHVLLPLTGLFVALFAGWRLRADEARAQFAFRSPCTFDAWLWLTRLVVPLLLAVLILSLPELLA
jgi:NSS family neurotransmitter:Na+ symporter